MNGGTESEGFTGQDGPGLFPELDQAAAARQDSGCPFCKRIAAGEYDEEPRRGCYIFEPLNPVTPGHLLVVPGEHVSDVSVAPATAAAVMFEAAMKVQRLGFIPANIITSIGIQATQTVYHLHVHIVPRREGDGLWLPWTGQNPDEIAVSRSDVDAVLELASANAGQDPGPFNRLAKAVGVLP